VYVPPAGVQTTIGLDRRFVVSDGRCADDPLMESAAQVYGAASLGVVLSGRLRDRAQGLRQIKQAGGRGLIQAPETAQADGMPLAAMATGCCDFALSPRALRAALVALVAVPGAADRFGVRGHPAADAGCPGVRGHPAADAGALSRSEDCGRRTDLVARGRGACG
jgi:hypothetical protein